MPNDKGKTTEAMGGYMKASASQTKKSRRPLSVFGMTLLFVLISFGGWCFEKVGRYFLYGSLGDRGFLSLPLCPIYGTCVLGIGPRNLEPSGQDKNKSVMLLEMVSRDL